MMAGAAKPAKGQYGVRVELGCGTNSAIAALRDEEAPML